MSRIATGQLADRCMEWILDYGIKKINEPKIGVNFIYGDFLYLLTEEKASTIKELFMIEVIKHKNSLQKLLQKNKQSLQIQHAFTFKTDNPYLGQYNLENSKFYDFGRFDLETWDYE